MKPDIVLHVRETWLARVLTDIFSAKGITTREVHSLDAGLETAPSLIIAQLPERVEEVAPALAPVSRRGKERKIPLIALASSRESCRAAHAVGVAACLTLPLSLAELRDKVDALLP